MGRNNGKLSKCCCTATSSSSVESVDNCCCKMNRRIEKIAVIGAGPSGLCCAKNALDFGHDVVVYEMGSNVGGLWNYTNQTGHDEFGIPIHSTMYNGVVTNVPVESMGFFNYPFKKRGQRSFVRHEEVLQFYHNYANDHNLHRVIRFRNYVVNVRPLPDDRWQVLSKDLHRDSYESETFDAIFLCNGHYTNASTARFTGLDTFRGHQMHSRDYRTPDRYQDQVVLLVGSGPSGRDIIYEIAPKAKQVIWSHHRSVTGHALPVNVKQFGDVERFNANSVQFVSGEEEAIDCVLFCTGYTFSFPFLSVDCGLSLEDMYFVRPLYKHMININRPTMAIVGLQICAYSYMYDLQARLCLRYWNKEIEISSQQMLDEFRIENERRKEKGNSIRQAHLLSTDQNSYFHELSKIGNLIKMPEVLLKIFDDCNDLRLEYPNTYREFNYTVIDDETFERHHVPD